MCARFSSWMCVALHEGNTYKEFPYMPQNKMRKYIRKTRGQGSKNEDSNQIFVGIESGQHTSSAVSNLSFASSRQRLWTFWIFVIT